MVSSFWLSMEIIICKYAHKYVCMKWDNTHHFITSTFPINPGCMALPGWLVIIIRWWQKFAHRFYICQCQYQFRQKERPWASLFWPNKINRMLNNVLDLFSFYSCFIPFPTSRWKSGLIFWGCINKCICSLNLFSAL